MGLICLTKNKHDLGDKLSFSFDQFHKTISDKACGVTLDWQRLPDGVEVCQWLWGRPVSGDLLNKSHEELLEEALVITQSAELSNLIPHNPVSLGLNLPNEAAVLDACPFRPGDCAGSHLVVSGSAQISP